MRTQRRVLILLVVLLMVSSWLPSRIARRVSSGPRDLLMAVLVPAGWLQNATAPITGRSDLRDRRTDRTADYDQAIRRIQNLTVLLEKANKRISQLSQIRRRHGLQGVSLQAARIINRAGRPGHEVLTLNVGERDGLGEGMAVVDGVNLVGRIIGVTAARATVRPINTVPSHLAARVQSPTVQPDRQGAQVLLKSQEDGRRFTERVNVGHAIVAGDWAHLADRNWPDEAQGFVIGHVTEVVKDQDDPLQHRIVTVVPVRSVDMLHDVTVLVPFDSTGGGD